VLQVVTKLTNRTLDYTSSNIPDKPIVAFSVSLNQPNVSSVIAQLLQCNPSLTPADVRTLLFKTATRLPHLEAARQGFGVRHPRKAIIQLVSRETIFSKTSPLINHDTNTIEFYLQHDSAYQITVAGDFNG
jgi:serine protease AprX